MNKYKICVYAICKNESKFIKRWYESMKEADEIYVLDTGSTDNTIEELKKYNIHYKQKILNPWRFDVARNEALSMIPDETDICVSTDIDEVFEPGWRKKLEECWKENTTRASYTFNWSLDENNKPIVTFMLNKIHKKNEYIWTHPVHEVLTKKENTDEVIVQIPEIILNHYPDCNKSRSSYLGLLELSVKEDPTDDRNMHYLGREYMYYKDYKKAISTLTKHLEIEKSTWKDERAASMRFIARSYKNLGNIKEALAWYDKAINEASYLRDGYIEKALLCYELEKYNDVIELINKALKIKEHEKTYINEVFSWNETPYDLLSIAYFYTNDYLKALVNVDKALEINPNDKRLKENQKIILKNL